MTLAVDVFWSFRSPYSYLATGRLVELEKRFDLEVGVRPVLPLAVRDPNFFQKVNPLWPPYLMRDTLRVAQYHGIDYGWPRPDPVVQVPKDGRLITAPEQPYIHRLTRLGILAVERGRDLPFIDQVSRLIWNGKVDGWHQGTHLADATARAGLDLVELDVTAEREADRLDAAIARNQKDLEAAGHWGVPTMVFEGEPFFGQDRIDLLIWRMEQRGLRSR
jgi:2-hydroxychromene-2-carboxylate isomerase